MLNILQHLQPTCMTMPPCTTGPGQTNRGRHITQLLSLLCRAEYKIQIFLWQQSPGGIIDKTIQYLVTKMAFQEAGRICCHCFCGLAIAMAWAYLRGRFAKSCRNWVLYGAERAHDQLNVEIIFTTFWVFHQLTRLYELLVNQQSFLFCFQTGVHTKKITVELWTLGARLGWTRISPRSWFIVIRFGTVVQNTKLSIIRF